MPQSNIAKEKPELIQIITTEGKGSGRSLSSVTTRKPESR